MAYIITDDLFTYSELLFITMRSQLKMLRKH